MPPSTASGLSKKTAVDAGTVAAGSPMGRSLKSLEVVADQEHEGTVILLNDDTGRVVIREERVDGESKRGV